MANSTTRHYYCLRGDNLNVDLLRRFLRAPRKPKCKTLYYDDSYNAQEDSQCGSDDSGPVEKVKKKKKIKRAEPLSNLTTEEYLKIMAKRSQPHVQSTLDRCRASTRTTTCVNNSEPFRTKRSATLPHEPTRVPSTCLQILEHPITQDQLRIYRKHLDTKAERCCPCNPSAVSELVVNLHNCHKRISWGPTPSNSARQKIYENV